MSSTNDGTGGWTCAELRDGWCWLRRDKQARVFAAYHAPDVFNAEVRDGDFFVSAGTFGRLQAALRACERVLAE